MEKNGKEYVLIIFVIAGKGVEINITGPVGRTFLLASRKSKVNLLMFATGTE